MSAPTTPCSTSRTTAAARSRWFREEIANKSKYDGIAQAAELTQTPSMVILYKDEADSAQGYMDAAAINAKITRLTGDSGPGD